MLLGAWDMDTGEARPWLEVGQAWQHWQLAEGWGRMEGG